MYPDLYWQQRYAESIRARRTDRICLYPDAIISDRFRQEAKPEKTEKQVETKKDTIK